MMNDEKSAKLLLLLLKLTKKINFIDKKEREREKEQIQVYLRAFF